MNHAKNHYTKDIFLRCRVYTPSSQQMCQICKAVLQVSNVQLIRFGKLTAGLVSSSIFTMCDTALDNIKFLAPNLKHSHYQHPTYKNYYKV